MMDGIIGHENAKRVIGSALAGGRVHHAWIFHGPDGVGKRTTALAFARVLLCHSPKDQSACGGCPSCRMIGKGGAESHPDLHVIRKEQAGDSEFRHLRERKQLNIPVDLLRERMLGGFVAETYIDPIVGLRPMMNHNKVFIIDEAEKLDRFGQSVLLKTLEEPPSGTYIILVTSNEEELYPTIRSRCQRIGFGELGASEIAAWTGGQVPGVLGEIQEQITALSEQKRISQERQEKLARLKSRAVALGDVKKVTASVNAFAGGSLGRVRRMLRYGQFEWPGIVLPVVKRLAAGVADVDAGGALYELIQNDALDWVDDHKNASKEAANRAAAGLMFSILCDVCRGQLREAARAGGASEPEAVESAARPWLRGIELVREAERSIESNVNLALLVDNLCIQWAASGASAMASVR